MALASRESDFTDDFTQHTSNQQKGCLLSTNYFCLVSICLLQ